MQAAQKSPKNKKTNLRPIFSIIGILIIAAITLLVFKLLESTGQTNQTPENTYQPTSANSTSSETSSSEALTTHETQTEAEAYDESVNNLGYLTGSISSVSVADGYLYVYTNIDQGLSKGTCELTITNGETTFAATANIVALPHTASCYNLRVPSANLTSGTWDLTITITSDDKTGVITSTEEISL